MIQAISSNLPVSDRPNEGVPSKHLTPTSNVALKALVHTNRSENGHMYKLLTQSSGISNSVLGFFGKVYDKLSLLFTSIQPPSHTGDPISDDFANSAYSGNWDHVEKIIDSKNFDKIKNVSLNFVFHNAAYSGNWDNVVVEILNKRLPDICVSELNFVSQLAVQGGNFDVFEKVMDTPRYSDVVLRKSEEYYPAYTPFKKKPDHYTINYAFTQLSQEGNWDVVLKIMNSNVTDPSSGEKYTFDDLVLKKLIITKESLQQVINYATQSGEWPVVDPVEALLKKLEQL